MNGDMLLPRPAAAEKAVQAQQNMMLTQFRMTLAKDIQMMLLAKAIQPLQSDEPWRDTEELAITKADLLAQAAQTHTDALLRALFPDIQIGKQK